jgi:hypothetical protein
MTTQTQNTQAQYINFHAEGVAYVNRFRENETRNGDTFCSVTLGFLHGQVGQVGSKIMKPSVTYIDCNIRNAEICELFKQHKNAINGEVKVTAVAKISDIYAADPFETTVKGKKQMVSAIKARLIGLKQLKIDGRVVWQKTESELDEQNEAEIPEQAAEPVVNQESASEPQAEMPVEDNDANAELPEMVHLDPNAADFQSRKDELKAQGYRWSKDDKAWVLAA